MRASSWFCALESQEGGWHYCNRGKREVLFKAWFAWKELSRTSEAFWVRPLISAESDWLWVCVCGRGQERRHSGYPQQPLFCISDTNCVTNTANHDAELSVRSLCSLTHSFDYHARRLSLRLASLSFSCSRSIFSLQHRRSWTRTNLNSRPATC